MRHRRLTGEAGQSDLAFGIVATVVCVGLIVGVIWAFMFIRGWHSTPVDKVALHYTGGPVEGEKFARIVQPGSGTKFYGLLDKQYLLPVTQRDFVISNDESADRKGSIVVPVKGVEMRFEVAAFFALNTSDEVIPRFFERVCRKYDCTSEDGWDRMLDVNFYRPIAQSLQQAARPYDVGVLYASQTAEGGTSDEAVAALAQLQEDVAKGLKDNINRVMGGPYFCGPTFDRNNPDVCPDFEFVISLAEPTNDNVKNAFAANRTSEIALQTAVNETKVKREEAAAVAAQRNELGAALSPEFIAYLQAQADLECAKRQGCTFIRNSAGSGVIVQNGQPQ